MSDVNDVLSRLRVNYQLEKLDIKDSKSDPFQQFDYWLKEAISAKCDEPNAFTLSTVKGGQPRGRILLLKGIYENKFVFYTNYKSAKGGELEKNKKVAMTFLWLPLQRQVRIEGVVAKVSGKLSDEYFSGRPRGSQIGAIASPQSKKVESRKILEDKFKEIENKYQETQQLPRPSSWGGYEVKVNYFEFWQGRDNRLHDRICYKLKNKSWDRFRIAP